MLMQKFFEEMMFMEMYIFVSNFEVCNDDLLGFVIDEMWEVGEFGRVQFVIEDIGWWFLMGFFDSVNFFMFDVLYYVSELCWVVVIVNFFVGCGLCVCIGYVWGFGVLVVLKEFIQGLGCFRIVNLEFELFEGINEVLIGMLVQFELEWILGIDGNFFFFVDCCIKEVLWVLFEEIIEGVSQCGNRECLLYIWCIWNDWDLELDYEVNIELNLIIVLKVVVCGWIWMCVD